MNNKAIFIKNETSDTIIITNNNVDLVIDSNEEKQIDLQNNDYIMTLIFNESHIEKTFIEKIFSFILGLIISIPLSFVYYFEFKAIDTQVFLPVKTIIDVKQLKNEKNYIVIKESKEQLKKYSLKMNETDLKTDVVFSENELQYEIKQYKFSNFISLLFPLIILIIAFFAFILSKNYVLALITFLILFVFGIVNVFLNMKNEKKINEIRQKFK